MQNVLLETLGAVVAALEGVGLRYAVTGSVASSVHGEPFVSEHVDLIVVATPDSAKQVASALGDRFYAPADMLFDAARRHAMANVVDHHTSLKVDLSFVAPAGFLAGALNRATELRIGSDGPVFRMVTPEDVILMKLLRRRDTQSRKQWDNALGVMNVQRHRLDWKYLHEQAESLGIRADLIRMRDEAGI